MADEDLPQYDSDSDKEEEAPSARTQQTAGHISTSAASFRDFLLKPELLRAINDCAFEHPSKVQEEAIPDGLAGHDIVAQAKAGMGKTAVFVTVILERIAADEPNLQALVVVHTRELAYQVAKEFERFKAYLEGITVQCIYGGVPLPQQEASLVKDKPHIVVGCPGRLKVLVQRKALDLSRLKIFVIDEVDKVLEKADMRQDVQEIFYTTPKNKQTMCFSATLPPEIKGTVMKFVQKPKEILIDMDKLSLHGLSQFYIKLEESQKTRKLTDLMDILEFNQVVIFVRDKRRCHSLNKILQESKFPSIELHSDMEAAERIATYNKFKKFEARILVTTDLGARGLDIERVNIVFNYDFPIEADTYMHRVGRAGRFGNKGMAISFISSTEDPSGKINDQSIFEKVQARFAVKVEPLPDEIDLSSYMPKPGVKEQFDE
uniref:RNA helicase n=1 Tax=Hanusia phi TaxID=3032 RepID=A0A7S0DXR8_9CRYP